MPVVRIELVTGDITAEQVDAVVNAANSSLLGGGGADGAIHRKRRPAICRSAARFGPAGTGGACRSDRPWRSPRGGCPPDG
jgi:O-acetyl-ADP-ribose deacetylase (regulator of RNase III)